MRLNPEPLLSDPPALLLICLPTLLQGATSGLTRPATRRRPLSAASAAHPHTSPLTRTGTQWRFPSPRPAGAEQDQRPGVSCLFVRDQPRCGGLCGVRGVTGGGRTCEAAASAVLKHACCVDGTVDAEIDCVARMGLCVMRTLKPSAAVVCQAASATAPV